ncbi:MAG: RNA polymerase sigma factor [Akkermansiaceae bacterium]
MRSIFFTGCIEMGWLGTPGRKNAFLQYGAIGGSVNEVINWLHWPVPFELITVNIFRHITSKLLRVPLPAGSGPASGPLMALAMEGEMRVEHGGRGAPEDGQTGLPPHSDGETNETMDKDKTSALEDARWVEQAKSGDTRAFDQLVSKHRGRIYAMIYQMVRNDADAWDLAQEAFIKAWRALPGFESRARFTTWLFRIAHNVVYDWLRKRRMKVAGELNDEVFDSGKIDPGASTAPQQHQRPDEAMQRSELQQRIQHALDKLSDEHREVIVLREIQGLEYKEIAEIINSSMGTVMSRLYYARQKLQVFLKSEI